METLKQLLSAWADDNSAWVAVHDHLCELGYPKQAKFHFFFDLPEDRCQKSDNRRFTCKLLYALRLELLERMQAWLDEEEGHH